jgi:AcrR family transcriptional regulator
VASTRAGKKTKPDRAARILDAADTLFCDSGFDGTSLRDVAETAEVNKGLILYYYKSKAGLFGAVLERYYETHAGVLKLSAEGPLREQVRGMLDRYFDFVDSNRRYARLIQQEVARSGQHSPLIRKNLASLFGQVQEALGDLLPAEGPLSPKHFFLTLSGMTVSYFTYAPVLRSLWGESPLSRKARDERRAHMHWVVECMLAGLDRPMNT